MQPKRFNARTSEVAKALNLSAETIYSRIKDGTFRQGKEYAIASNANARKRTYRWDLEAVNAFLATEARKRG